MKKRLMEFLFKKLIEDKQIEAINAFTHWLFYAEMDDLKKAFKEEGGEHMVNHFTEKLRGFSNRYGGYLSIEALAKFDRELSKNWQNLLYKVILKEHTNKW